ncbi:MAG: hypothetical protein WA949_19595 [Phormidesmis sp.]
MTYTPVQNQTRYKSYPHREKVTTLVLTDGDYEATAYAGRQQIKSQVFPTLVVTADDLPVR